MIHLYGSTKDGITKLYAARVTRNPLRVYRHIKIILPSVLTIVFKYIWYNKVARKINCRVSLWLEELSLQLPDKWSL